MSTPFGFTNDETEDPDERGVAVVPEVTWDEVIGDGYIEGDEDEGYA